MSAAPPSPSGSPPPSSPPPSSPPPPSPPPPAGWHPDPTGRFEFRWFNGDSWTADVATSGVRSIDPFGTAASVPAQAATSSQPPRGLAIASLVLGLTGVALAWLPFLVIVGVGAALGALGLGVLAMHRISTGTGSGPRAAMAGVVTGVLALVLSTVGVANTRDALREIQRYTEPGEFTIAIDECRLDDTMAVATGTITNDSAVQTRRYIIRVSLLESSTELALARTDVAPLQAGETAQFTVSAFVGAIEPDRLRCRIDKVTGPLPFDLG